MIKGAVFSKDESQAFRYKLWRIWDDSKPIIAFVGLNPSKANEEIDDNTITKCINFTQSWGYGGFYMINLFAFKSTKPKELYNEDNDIIGDENDQHILEVLNKVDLTICVWGNHGKLQSRSKIVLGMIKEPHCLKINVNGEPAHPLYLSNTLKPIPYVF